MRVTVLFALLVACGGPTGRPEDAGPGDAAPPDDASPPPTLTIDPEDGQFGSIWVGESSTPVTFTITNTDAVTSGTLAVSIAGPDAGAFSFDDTCDAPLAPLETCTASVTFSPLWRGPKIASLRVAAAPGGQAVATLGGLALGPAMLVASITPGMLGAVEVGTTSTTKAHVTVTNAGDEPSGAIALQPAGATPFDFVVSSDTCSGVVLPPDATCSFLIALAPRSAGPKSSRFRIAALPGGDASASVSGRGLASASLVGERPNRNFGSVVTGRTSSPLPIIVINRGDVTSGPMSIALSGPDASLFSQLPASTCSELAPGGRCTIMMTFSPTSAGTKRAWLDVRAGASRLRVALDGRGIPPGQLSISPTAHDFGGVVIEEVVVGLPGLSPTQVFTITNEGTAPTGPLVISPSTFLDRPIRPIAGGDTCSGTALAPGATCTVALAYYPGTDGGDSLLVVAGAPGGEVIAAVSGHELAEAQLAFDFEAVDDLGMVPIGATSDPLVLEIQNRGDRIASASTIWFDGMDASRFSLEENTCTTAIPPRGRCWISIVFEPLFIGRASTSVRINATASTYVDGRGVAPEALTYVPSVLVFPPLVVGESSMLQVTLVNTGSTTRTFMQRLNASSFSLGSTPCSTLAPGESCSTTVIFNTSYAGWNGADLAVAADPSPQALLFGFARNVIELASAHDTWLRGPGVVLGTQAERWMTFRNNASTTLPFFVQLLPQPGYSIIESSCASTNTIAAGGLCTVGVSVAPSALGHAGTSVRIGPMSWSVPAVGIESLEMTALDGGRFPSTYFGEQSAPLRFRIINAAGAPASGPLTVSLSGSGLSIVTDTCSGQSLPSAGACLVAVAFTPVTGNESGSLVVEGHPGGRLAAFLDGRGTDDHNDGLPPTAIALSPPAVPENAQRAITMPVSVDPDPVDLHEYDLVDGAGSEDNAAFTIVNRDLHVRGAFDFETKSTYRIRLRSTDVRGNWFEQAVVLGLTNVDEDPIAIDDHVGVLGGSLPTVIDVLANERDVDGGPRSVAKTTQPTNGIATVGAGGVNIRYQPNPGFVGTDSFVYELMGGSVGWVTIHVR